MYDQFHYMVELITIFCVLLLVFAAVKHYSKNSLFPAEAWILMLGMAYGLITVRYPDLEWLPELSLDPVFVLVLFLPLLIFSSGRLIKPGVLKTDAVPVCFFAIAGVVATAFMIAYPLSVMLGASLLDCLVLGVALAATDPIAVGAIFKNFKIPERLYILVEGESLFNDGVTVVLFSLVSGLVISNAMFSLSHSMFDICWAIFGAVPVGLATGWLSAKILNIWCEDQNFFVASMTIILAYSTFLLSEQIFHVSGVIAVLVSAISFGRFWKICKRDTEREDHTAKITTAFWDYISQVLNAFLFFFLGVETAKHDFSGLPLSVVAGALLILVLSRMIVVYGGSLLLCLTGNKLPFSWQNVLLLGGVRGAVPAALILLVPHDYAYHQMFMCLAFAMIAFTLIVQPPLMRIYLKKVQIPE